MTQSYNRSLSLALRRLRFAVVVAGWLVAFALGAQVVVWSLTAFTDLRYGEPEPPQDAPLIIQSKEPGDGRIFVSATKRRRNARAEEPAEEVEPTKGVFDGVFATVVTASRAIGLLAAIVICPLVGLGIMIAVPAGAPRIERAVTAFLFSIVLVILVLPLGGWFGFGWHEGTIWGYERLTAKVEAAQDAGFSLKFFMQFLLLPAASAVGFAMVGLRFSAAMQGVLLKVGMEGVDPALDREATSVEASSLHGTGRSAGALKNVMKSESSGTGRRPNRSGSAEQSPMTSVRPTSPMSTGKVPKRLL